ncbi:MAG TPA: Sir2 family NAD-dependent protein deacetylase [Accumulibacter sp.]|uniref:SIR2 family NAD-dependent protein deacylase n=1 Tax=Accumulibacter sp. TaxID=2053492 RepID=UPI0025CF035E|nr:Sir2 family NAD-dependent protein deacetylase [Accumulibacter sp.]MCM8597067.1 NAD-dependent deacetylase [Accumulibacter sp.]MCM8663652.1 NAD-dependent deacetylase [Accumulibacter sp.]HNC51051.1 Sir2 family NAD-dependent protein deacetylase [Accumulibacter sp.]
MTAAYRRCAELIQQADGLLVTAGAGIGVDSGLPDFRGPQGFWGAYPALGRARIAFEQIANPAAFARNSRLAWGFYGHRLNLYRHTVPHEGFQILRRIGEGLPHGAFVFTSNVDGQFQKAGFAETRISECHGSIHHLQCFGACHDAIWPADDFHPEIDEERCLLSSELPLCPHCRGMARPNILMFGDWQWLSERSDAQEAQRQAWLRHVERLLVIEVGAGTNIPTVRLTGERLRGQLIRINPREPQLPPGKGISLAAGCLTALRAIEACLG